MKQQELEVLLLNANVEMDTIIIIKNVKNAPCNVKLVLISQIVVLLVSLTEYYKIKLNAFAKMDIMKLNNLYVNYVIINVVRAKMMP